MKLLWADISVTELLSTSFLVLFIPSSSNSIAWAWSTWTIQISTIIIYFLQCKLILNILDCKKLPFVIPLKDCCCFLLRLFFADTPLPGLHFLKKASLLAEAWLKKGPSKFLFFIDLLSSFGFGWLADFVWKLGSGWIISFDCWFLLAFLTESVSQSFLCNIEAETTFWLNSLRLLVPALSFTPGISLGCWVTFGRELLYFKYCRLPTAAVFVCENRQGTIGLENDIIRWKH